MTIPIPFPTGDLIDQTPDYTGNSSITSALEQTALFGLGGVVEAVGNKVAGNYPFDPSDPNYRGYVPPAQTQRNSGVGLLLLIGVLFLLFRG